VPNQIPDPPDFTGEISAEISRARRDLREALQRERRAAEDPEEWDCRLDVWYDAENRRGMNDFQTDLARRP
jgi:hypothetical protein